jgi:protein-disulfide isomerase
VCEPGYDTTTMMNDVPRLAVPVNDEDHLRGPLDAPVTLVEYGDFECPYCGLAYPAVKAIENAYAGSVCFVYRNFPLPMHPHAQIAAETSEFAADYDRFWEMHDTLFEHQRALDAPHLLGYAQRLGLDPAALATALETGRYRTAVEKQKRGGAASGVPGTPAFFLNGVMFPEEPTFEAFSSAIDQLLAHRRRTRV